MIIIKPLSTIDSGIERLANLAAMEGHANSLRSRDEFSANDNWLTKPGECLFGAFHCDTKLDSDTLIGCAGLNVDPYSTDQSTGRIRRLYVAPEFRNRGVGELLIKAIESAATAHFQILHVNTSSPSASRFFEHRGYHPVPLENISHVKRLHS